MIQSIRVEETGQKLITTRIEHKHHLHKGVWIAISLLITCFFLAYGWVSSHQSSRILEANDIKYRYLKIRGNKNVLNLCKYTDSLYQKDTDGFCARVEHEEQHLTDQVNVLRLAG